MDDVSRNTDGFLGADEPPAFELLDVCSSRPALLVCDHASARVPARLGDLGLPSSAFTSHIGLDIGAVELMRKLSQRLNLPAVTTGYSRLVVDCNRRLADPSAFPEISDGQVVPGNRGLSQEDRGLRADSLYWPYHDAIRDQLLAQEAKGEAPALIAIHSFSPVLAGEPRPWHFGILWDKDPRIPVPLMAALNAHPGLLVGDNEPYSGKHASDFTIDHHAEAEGLPHVSIEIRQDLLGSEAELSYWAELLAEALLPLLDDPDLYKRWSDP